MVWLSEFNNMNDEKNKYIGKKGRILSYNKSGWYTVMVEGEEVKWRGKKNMQIVKKNS